MRQRSVDHCWEQGAVTLKAATGAQKFVQELATDFQAIVLMWQQKVGLLIF